MGLRKPAEVARATGIPAQTLDIYLKGSAPRADRAYALADELGVNPRWLVLGEGQQRAVEESDDDWLVLPRYDLQRFEVDHLPEPVEMMRIRREWLSRAVRTPGRLWVVELLSDAMPDIGKEGDMVLCEDFTPPLADGRVYAFLLDGRPIVRSVQARPDGLVLKAGSPAIDPITLTGEQLDQLVPIGRVVAAINLQAI